MALPKRVAEVMARTMIINENVSDVLHHMLDEADLWAVGGGPTPTWAEIKTAITATIDAIDEERIRQGVD